MEAIEKGDGVHDEHSDSFLANPEEEVYIFAETKFRIEISELLEDRLFVYPCAEVRTQGGGLKRDKLGLSGWGLRKDKVLNTPDDHLKRWVLLKSRHLQGELPLRPQVIG
ncbi:MAG TPA: hypothetical protein VF514_07530, partial [Bacteroidota bacterium]